MTINWISYYAHYDGYGRFSARLVKQMQEFGLDVLPITVEDTEKPKWMLDQMRVDWNNLSITCHQPFNVPKVKGKHWLYTMCEGSQISKALVKAIHKCGVELILVPSQFCKDVYEDSGVKIPIKVVPLGTDPEEFPMRTVDNSRPYTFLALSDRGDRKGWQEVYYAFYKAFGSKTDGIKDVRLIIKSLPKSNRIVDLIARAKDMDPRISVERNIYDDMSDFFNKGDCFAIPSRCEGWGMPHREAAMMGLEVLTQKFSGMDDGHLDKWAYIVGGGKMTPIPPGRRGSRSCGEWMIADIQRLADAMLYCYNEPDQALTRGKKARAWLSGNQTWQDAAAGMIELLHDEGVLDGESIRGIRKESSFPYQNGGDHRTILASNFPVR